jgi:putative nucleotidyltransferase with HDIG domain
MNENEIIRPIEDESYMDLDSVSDLLLEQSIPESAIWLGNEVFGNVFRYIVRYLERYNASAFKILFTIQFKEEDSLPGKKDEIVDRFRGVLQDSLRNSDVMVQVSRNQILIVLQEVNAATIDSVLERMLHRWKRLPEASLTDLDWETQSVSVGHKESGDGPRYQKEWIVIVDDDVVNLKIAEHVLNKGSMRTTSIKSGRELIDFLEINEPDLILLDINMPEMDGFETLRKMRDKGGNMSRIPVIFLTADDNKKVEAEGFALDAMDFIRKPFVPEILTARVKRAVRMIRLQNHLEEEVSNKVLENEQMLIHIVQTLATTIDAKDTYTNGHSTRVANYSKEIARRFGYRDEKLDDIYMMGLLHDIGKIGVPDTVINKPGRLTDDEFEQIKNHPVMGARILKNIKEKPKLSCGARWHHERYSGGGYPDGLLGEDIPEEARIIAVADAYDAMTSCRSYREPMPQARVREEIVKGRGTQFDPIFADIMLDMIDEDVDYEMRES